jgi:hypothetical protein
MHRLLALAALLAVAPLAQLGDAMPALLRALQLPALVTEARRAGVSETAVQEVLDGLRRRGLPADEAALVIGEEVDAVHAGAPPDNFGAFVHRQLDAGLRGRALAEAIRADHQARGIGREGGRPSQPRDTARSRRSRP